MTYNKYNLSKDAPLTEDDDEDEEYWNSSSFSSRLSRQNATSEMKAKSDQTESLEDTRKKLLGSGSVNGHCNRVYPHAQTENNYSRYH